MRAVATAVLILTASPAFGQSTETAKSVYNASEESVFLIYLNDSSGTPNALGSAFLVAPRILVTNAHVADAGSPVLAIGPVRIPLKVLRTDEKNDLATLAVDVDLTSKPLPLAVEPVTPGDAVFAIGNPEGLEKTISQGIVSGVRDSDNRKLLQITTPISHGSSGGPILNSKGEVVGVAVGMLEDGQNLNFAVPVEFVRGILAPKDKTTQPIDVQADLDQAKTLLDKRGKADYSTDASSEYQQDTRQLQDLLGQVLDSTAEESALAEVACLGTKATDLSDDGIKATRILVRQNPSAERRALLAYVLLDRAEDENSEALTSQKDSQEQTQATEAQKNYLMQASDEATEVIKTAKGKTLLLADFVLGEAKQQQNQFPEAVQFQTSVANGNLQLCDTDLTELAVRNLIWDTSQANTPAETEEWFNRLATQYEPNAFDWDSEGDRRAATRDFAAAGNAYEKAAQMASYLGYDYCFAANDRYLQTPRAADSALADGRSCVDASVKNVIKENTHYFDGILPSVYSDMAEILNDRGVYQPALEYIKESLSRQPEEPLSLITEASILENLERYSECVAVAKAAVGDSDGKYPWMEFRLGSCYFDEEDWSHAADSFRISAAADKTDAPSAFNLGLSLQRQGYTADAKVWFREALNRQPDDELKAKILNELQ
jgi:tetratricopeptide (TPR) repeat protein